MGIHFTEERWKEVRKNYQLWWERKLDRPLLKISHTDAYIPDREEPRCPRLTQANCHDFSYTAEEIIDRVDYELSKVEFLGDGFPFFNLACFGPGIVSAFCGAKLDNSSGRVWFFAEEEKEISDIHVKYDPENIWAKRIKDIYRAGNERWQGMVLMGLPDLGGIMDIMAILRGSENLLFDLYDEPEEVTRLRKEIEVAWKDAFLDLSKAAKADKYGYTDWGGLYSKTPAYITQCDFCYMISNDMFREFVLPSIEDHMEFLDHNIYHLDGIGELKHLDDLLALEKLDAIQWVFGAGQPSAKHWIDSVYKKIEAAKKGIFVIENMHDFDDVYEEIKDNLYYNPYIETENLYQVEKYLANF